MSARLCGLLASLLLCCWTLTLVCWWVSFLLYLLSSSAVKGEYLLGIKYAVGKIVRVCGKRFGLVCRIQAVNAFESLAWWCWWVYVTNVLLLCYFYRPYVCLLGQVNGTDLYKDLAIYKAVSFVIIENRTFI